jgi:hypothetical protein
VILPAFFSAFTRDDGGYDSGLKKVESALPNFCPAEAEYEPFYHPLF